MKLVFEEGELERLKEIHEKYPIDILSPDPEQEQSVSFKVTNPSLANYIMAGLLHNKLPEVDLGIDVTAVSLIGHTEWERRAEEAKRAVIKILG